MTRQEDRRIILHFDYDCFYAAVFEKENPSLKNLPLAVQQKQIIVTCNYEARRRGLYKLQRITEARETCPEVIIVLGEDLTRFRDASKDNYNFLRKYVWSNKVERLGFDEVFMDVTDMIDHNMDLLNPNDLSSAFFCLDRDDPTIGFSYQADHIFGHTYPTSALLKSHIISIDERSDMQLRLCLGSHLAQYLSSQLVEQHGYTSTVGISTNKLLAKLVGNVNKPSGQTTLLPTGNFLGEEMDHAQVFIDDHDIGKIPGIGFKIAQKIREHVLQRPAGFDAGLVYGGSKENVKVRDVRLSPGMGPKTLEKILAGPGFPRDLAAKVWGLVNAVDPTDIAKGREVPQQISIEDSYIRLDEMSEVIPELKMLATSLIKRMQADLTSQSDNNHLPTPNNHEAPPPHPFTSPQNPPSSKTWIAHPKTLRLSTRPRPPLNADGTRPRLFTRISRSCALPSFVFDLRADPAILAERLVDEALLPLFSKLHPEKSGWNLSLVNLCVAKMVMAGSDTRRGGAGRDISSMFRRQEEDLVRRVVVEDHAGEEDSDVDMVDAGAYDHDHDRAGAGDESPRATTAVPSPAPTPLSPAGESDSGDLVQMNSPGNADSRPVVDWDSADGVDEMSESESESEGAGGGGSRCRFCSAAVPAFALAAHERFHDLSSAEEV